MRKLDRLLAVCLVAGLAACSDALNVVNPNNPDAPRALARPADVEALIAASYNTMHRATLGAFNLAPQVYVFGMENYSNLANFGNATRAQIPRPSINNSISNAVASGNYGEFLGLHQAARAAALGMSKVKDPDFTFFPRDTTQNNRAIAFAHFVIGVSLGQIAMAYDSGVAVHEGDDPTPGAAPLPLVDYAALHTYALARLDSAIYYTTIPSATPVNRWGTQTIPTTWMSTSAALSNVQFIALVRGWQARLRPAVARRPADNAGINWTQVRADAVAFLAVWGGATPGSATDLGLVQNLNTSLGWGMSFLPQVFSSASVSWHMMWGYMLHMSASQADYDAWLATAPSLRAPFPVVTPDRRFPNGGANCPGANCRLAQQCVSGAVTGAGCTGFSTTAGPFQYMENRATGNDWIGDPSGGSQYRTFRFKALALAANTIGPYPSMAAGEMRTLAAEAEYNLGNFVAAATHADATRIGRGVLPGLVLGGVTNATTLVPGGAVCVPRIPVAPFNVSACGNLFEAIKYETRMETQYTRWGGWYFNGRRWGDLPEGTAIHWPVPYQELLTRSSTNLYSTGGVGAATGLPVGNYGL